ncbi:hypothetical protein ACOMHN_035223 [Nucella lapillus]
MGRIEPEVRGKPGARNGAWSSPERNSEKRKEKSRDAARCRRGKESEVFTDLADCLPLPQSVISQLDKASVMRLTISFLRLQRILEQHHADGEEARSYKNNLRRCIAEEEIQDFREELDQLYSKALEGFVFILSREGDIIYISETVVKYLGIQQIELVGQSIFDFCDPRDEDEIQEALSVRSHGNKFLPLEAEDRVFFLRMKCTLTSKGRNVNLKSASHKVIKCSGKMVVPTGQHAGLYSYLVALGEPIPHPANIEVPMDSRTFLTKHSMDMKFTYCDDRVKGLLNYSEDDLEGRTLLDYHHAMDSQVVEKAYKVLLSKGQTVTGRYRFLAQGGGWAWVITQATVINSTRSQKAQWIVCIHYVLTQIEEPGSDRGAGGDSVTVFICSQIEEPGVILSEVQKKQQQRKEKEFLQGVNLDIRHTDMESLFSPMASNVEDSFFIPPWVNKVKMKKTNEQDHLTFLSPKAGEAGMPLELPSEMPSEMPSQLFQDPQMGLFRPGDLKPAAPSLVLDGLKQEPGLTPAFCRTQEARSCASFSPDSCVSPSSSSSSPRMGSPQDYGTRVSSGCMHNFFHTLDMKCDPKREDDTDLQLVRAPSTDDVGMVPSPPSTAFILSHQNDLDPAIHCRTDNIFRSQSGYIFEEPPTPPKPSLRDMMCGSPTVASIAQPPDIMFEQIKRPLDMNSLEKGPPVKKRPRFQPYSLQVPHMRSQKTLLNLLLNRADPSGYRTFLQGVAAMPPKSQVSEDLFNPLRCLNQQDCEVNAPIQSGPLLNGEDLLMALDTVMPQIAR